MESLGVAPLGFENIQFAITDHDEYIGGIRLLKWSGPGAAGRCRRGTVRPIPGPPVSFRPRRTASERDRGNTQFHSGRCAHRTVRRPVRSTQRQRLSRGILNYPLVHWAGRGVEGIPVADLLRRYGWAIHALEFNGMRPLDENQAVLGLARDWGKPVVGGGDSHLLVPSSVMCVSQTSSMADFIAEVKDGHSVALIKGDYWAPLGWKLFLRVLCFIAHYRQIASSRTSPLQKY